MLNKIRKFFLKDLVKQPNEEDEESLDKATSNGQDINLSDKPLVNNIMRLSELEAKDIMIPRAEMIAVKQDTSFIDLVEVFSKSAKLQLPVYKNTLDKILGIVSIHDMLPFCFKPKKFNMDAIMHDASFVVPSIKLDDLLKQMRTTGNFSAFVVDEFGGVDGLVTLDEIINKILGSIQQSGSEVSMESLIKQQDGSYLIDAKTLIEDAEKAFSIKLLTPELNDNDIPDVETVGGLVVALANHVPVKGETFHHPSGIVFEVVDSDPRRVKSIIARINPTDCLRTNT